ncbi:MAG TPA: hypothetical protein VM285_14575 [Polyangia bacterium]|nr:hypothetical protein [Polyangia bacterium]
MTDPTMYSPVHDSQAALSVEELERELVSVIYDCSIAIVASILHLNENRTDDGLGSLADEARDLVDTIRRQTLARQR